MPAPYMVSRLNTLSDRGSLDLTVWFNTRTTPGIHWAVDEESWRFAHSYVPHLPLGGRSVGFPTALLRGQQPDVLVSLHGEPSFTAGWGVARARGIRTALWVVKTFDSWTTRREYKESLKRYIFPRTDGVFVPGRDGAAYARSYGAHGDRIVLLPHPLDDRFTDAIASLRGDERQEVRAALGLVGITFIYVGRLWQGKGLLTLVEAFARVQERVAESSLMIVGEGVERSVLEARVESLNLRNVVFAGFHQKPELPRLYAASDVFVFPTLGDPYGLVVDEAMACGLPVVSTSAAGEITDRIQEGRTGFIVTPGSTEPLATKMLSFAANPGQGPALGRAARALISERTPERWCQQFEDGVAAMLDRRRV
jgi:glycosyltransferase involved in cell wall biosynthesis